MSAGLRVSGLRLAQLGFELGPLELEVAPGQALLVFGPSLAGKTRLLKALVGLAEAKGTVAINGQQVDLSRGPPGDDFRAQVGMVFQNDALFDHLTVAQNVALPLQRRDRSDTDITITSALSAVGLADAAAKLPAQLSGGMRKRAGLARALAVKPAVLLVDEPLAGLDPATQRRIAELLDQARAGGASVLIAVADPEPLWDVCANALALDAGRIVAQGPTPAVRNAARGLLGAA